MKTSLSRVLPAVAAVALAAFAASEASAGIVLAGSGTSAGGNAISALAGIQFSSNTMTITLRNTTAETFAPTELLAGFDFTLSGGLTVVGDLTSASALHGREVTGTGTGEFTDTAGAVNLLTAAGGSPTWEIGAQGSGYRMLFNPDAEYAIIGNPVGNAYANANGGIVGNDGHNPFAAYQATFTFLLSGNATDSNLVSGTFLYNTANFTTLTGRPNVGPDPFSVVPLPSSAWAGLAMLSALGVGYVRRRRRGVSSL
jgi:hypothetical protein